MALRLLISRFSTSSTLKTMNKALEFDKVVSSFESSQFGSTKEELSSRKQYFSALKNLHLLRSPFSKVLTDLSTEAEVYSLMPLNFYKSVLKFSLLGFLLFLAIFDSNSPLSDLEQQASSRSPPLSTLNSKHFIKSAKSEVKFKDVLGIDECREELEDLVSFLKEPQKFKDIGAKLPKGLLLTGSPGTGKTLLAKAVAGEANANFFHCSGSDFDEIYVGVGAKRVRDLFENAKRAAPCIIFIDEIDCLASHRSLEYGSSSRQSLNQLLVEMDGFEKNDSIIVIAATNFPDSLDKAILRAGRFDRTVNLPMPDMKGRQELFELYLSRIKLQDQINSSTLAKRTVGMTGADISNIVNIAALRAVGQNRTGCVMEDFELAIDRVTIGIEKRSYVSDRNEIRNVAIHEVGHALAAYYMKGADSVNKITILPRGNSLGHASIIDQKDEIEKTLKDVIGTIDTMMGGRAAEDVVRGKNLVTTGCSNDLMHATACAYGAIMAGMFKEKVGNYLPVSLEKASEQTRDLIDQTAMEVLQESYKRVVDLLEAKKLIIEAIVDELMVKETMSNEEIVKCIKRFE